MGGNSHHLEPRRQPRRSGNEYADASCRMGARQPRDRYGHRRLGTDSGPSQGIPRSRQAAALLQELIGAPQSPSFRIRLVTELVVLYDLAYMASALEAAVAMHTYGERGDVERQLATVFAADALHDIRT